MRERHRSASREQDRAYPGWLILFCLLNTFSLVTRSAHPLNVNDTPHLYVPSFSSVTVSSCPAWGSRGRESSSHVTLIVSALYNNYLAVASRAAYCFSRRKSGSGLARRGRHLSLIANEQRSGLLRMQVSTLYICAPCGNPCHSMVCYSSLILHYSHRSEIESDYGGFGFLFNRATVFHLIM